MSQRPPGLTKLFTCAWAFMLPLSGLRVPGIGSVADVILVVATLACLPQLGDVLNRWVLPSVIWFTGLMVVSSYWAVDPGASRVGAMRLSWGLIASLLVGMATARNGNTVTVCWAYVFGTVVLAVSTWIMPAAGHSGRAVGLAQNPVEVGGLTAVGACLALFLPVKSGRRTAQRIIILIIVSSIIGSLALTGVLAIAVGAGFALVLGKKMSLRGASLVVLFIVIAVYACVSLEGGRYLVAKASRSFGGRVGAGEVNTMGSRMMTWQKGWDRILDHPILGNGFDQQGQLVYGHLATHNGLLLWWQTGGVMALATFIALGILSLRGAWSLRRDPAGRAMAAAMMASWAAVMSGPTLYQRTWLLPVVLGVGLAAHRRRSWSSASIPNVRIATNAAKLSSAACS